MELARNADEYHFRLPSHDQVSLPPRIFGELTYHPGLVVWLALGLLLLRLSPQRCHTLHLRRFWLLADQ